MKHGFQSINFQKDEILYAHVLFLLFSKNRLSIYRDAGGFFVSLFCLMFNGKRQI